MLQSTHKYLINTAVIIPGEINLLTNGDGVEFGSVPAITGNKTITMDFKLDSSAGNMTLWFNTVGSNDYLLLVMGSVPETGSFGLTVQTRSNPSRVRRYYNMNSYINQLVNLEIIKTGTSITSVKMNSNTLTPNTGFFDPSDNPMKQFIGDGGLSIWNLEITGFHKWIGYPYGNTLGAWADTVGTNHATSILGTPGTRNLF